MTDLDPLSDAHSRPDATVPSGLPTDVVDRFMDGDCGAFAAEVHAATGWPVKGVTTILNDGTILEGDRRAHVVVGTPDGRFLDAAGLWTEGDLTAAWQHHCDTNDGLAVVIERDVTAEVLDGVPQAHSDAAASHAAQVITELAPGATPQQRADMPPPSPEVADAEQLFTRIADPTERRARAEVHVLREQWAARRVDLDVTHAGSGDLNLSLIRVSDDARGTGAADAAMRDLCATADRLGLRVTLTPAADFGANVGRLKRWYAKHGFVENKGPNRDYSTREDMYRDAR